MTASVLPRLAPSPSWELVSAGSPFVAVAERDALGTTARIATWPPRCLRPALSAVDAELARLDQAASRFRADSEICRVPVVVANGTEGELASAKDKVLAATEPNLVLDGVAVAAAILGASHAFVVVPDAVAETMRVAVAERRGGAPRPPRAARSGRRRRLRGW
jgi:hypothetical protein